VLTFVWVAAYAATPRPLIEQAKRYIGQ